MTLASGYAIIAESLRELRIRALEKLVLLTVASAYLTLIWSLWPTNTLPERRLIALLCLIMIALCWAVYAFRERFPRLCAVSFVTGLMIIISFIAVLFNNSDAGFLFLAPLIFAGTLVGRRSIILVGGISGILLYGMTLFYGPAFITPLLFLAVVTAAISVSLQNLYTTLSWALDGYERAIHNQNEARERKAELEHVLKSLDIASHNLQRANQALEIACERAEEAQQIKQRFAQSISHELRTPLNLIVGFTENMISAPEYYGSTLPTLYMRDLMIVHRNASHLQKLVNDVLDLSRLEAAQMGLHFTKTHPGELAEEAVETIRGMVEPRGIALRCIVTPDLPHLWVDPLRVKQILLNLLSNASRFTEQGSVTLRVYDDDHRIVFAVEDTGVGIPQEHLEHIFEAFHQIEHPIQKRTRGAGLGLAISQDLARLHGGHIDVSSELGVGSVFRLKLPISPVEAYHTGHSSLQAIRTVPSRDNVIVLVTKSMSAASLMSRFLQTCRIIVVEDMQHAKQAAQQNLPLALVVDTYSDSTDPTAVMTEVSTWGLPQICILTCPLPGEGLLQRSLSVNGFLIKPVSRATLWDTLRSFGEAVSTILVIDDDVDFGRLIERMIDSPLRRYRVLVSTDGREALCMMELNKPDLILLDLDMPHMNGVSFLSHIRAHTLYRDIPVVIVSGKDTLDDTQVLDGRLHLLRPSGFTVVETLKWVQHSLDALSGTVELTPR